jgi:uncharacterized repeat protein (TIGR01451 family)
LVSTDGVSWTLEDALPGVPEDQLRGVAWGDGLFVAVGQQFSGDSLSATSTDGLVWTGQPGLLPAPLVSVTWGEDRFVAVGSEGTIGSSLDGTTWSDESVAAESSLNGVVRGGAQFVAVGTGGAIFRSTCEVAAQEADLVLSMTDSPDPVVRRQQLTYALSVTNEGPAEARNLLLVDQLPRGVQLKSISSSQGECKAERMRRALAVTCRLGDLPVADQAVVEIVVRPRRQGAITNTASVSAEEPLDPDESNNVASEVTTVLKHKPRPDHDDDDDSDDEDDEDDDSVSDDDDRPAQGPRR